VVITSDHGEPLWNRGDVLHGLSLYEELVHIPLLILFPWSGTAARIDDVVSLIDLAPTLLDIAGIGIPPQFLGHSMMRQRGALAAPAAIGEQLEFRTNATLSWYAREGPWKLIASKEGTQLFHLPSDPGEEHDVGSRHPLAREYLTGQLMDRSAAFRGEGSKPVALGSGLSDENRKDLEDALRALGYVQ
jgi:arylsulfatase A-like enzyme